MEQYYDVADIANLIKMAVAPVFLLTGIGSFLGVLSTRVARIVDRARKLEELVEADRNAEASLAELQIQARRLRLIGWAIGLCVASALLICALVALLFLGGLLHFDPSEALGFLFVLAMVVLIVALVLFLREIQLTVRHTRVGGSIKRLGRWQADEAGRQEEAEPWMDPAVHIPPPGPPNVEGLPVVSKGQSHR